MKERKKSMKFDLLLYDVDNSKLRENLMKELKIHEMILK